MDTIEQKQADLGHRFEQHTPARTFQRILIAVDIAYVSGHRPHDEYGRLVSVGRAGREVRMAEAYEAARLVAVYCLTSLKAALGQPDRIEEVANVLGFVNSADDFHYHPGVLDGFTPLLIEVLGTIGGHARSAIGTSIPPNNQPVEVEMLVRIR